MLLLIGGHQRSGTTLVRRLCDRHPAMRVTSEVGSLIVPHWSYRAHSRHVLRRFRKAWTRYNFSSSHHNLVFVTRYLLTTFRFRRQGINSRTVEAVLRRMYPRAAIVGDKYPDYVYRLDKLAGIEGLRLVIIYRDCRDVVSSTLEQVRTSWRGMPFAENMDSVDKVAARWVSAIESMERHQEKLHMMRYESLVQNASVEVEALGRWLDVDPSGFPIREIRNTSIGKHRRTLSPEEVLRVMDVAGPTMKRLGYL